MKKIFVFIFFAVIVMSAPYAAQATEIGFVPSSGIWFSKQTIIPGEAIKIYAVIVNNAYLAVQADIAFYDNGDEMGIIKVAKLEKEQAHELWVQWTPQPGAHKIAARFIRASIIGADGQKTALDTGDLNTIGESSFVAPFGALTGGSTVVNMNGQSGIVQQEGAVASPTAVSDIAQGSNALAGSGVTVQVKKEGDNLMLKIVQPDLIAVASASATESEQNAKTESITSKNNNFALEKNTIASSTPIEHARNIVATVTEKVKNVSESVKEAREITVRTIRKARAFAEQGRVRAEVVGQAARAVGHNKIALAWIGFLAFITIAAVLSYVRWRKYR